MAEQIISPGVFTRENDQSFITQQPVVVGAAIIGPTVKGPVEIPTVVTSYSQFENIFGATLISGSQTYSFLTSISVYNYFQNGGNSLLVTRVTNGDFDPAISDDIQNSIVTVEGAPATGSFTFDNGGDGIGLGLSYGAINYYFISSSTGVDIPGSNIFVYDDAGTNLSGLVAEINESSSAYFSASYTGDVLEISASFNGTAGNVITLTTGSLLNMLVGVNTPFQTLEGGVDSISGQNTLVLKTISEGAIMNSTGSEDSTGALANGTVDNLRWEITTSNTGSGTFTLNIRRGDDITNEKVVLETFTNLSLDPESENFVSRRIGNTYQQVTTDSDGNNYIQTIGEYPNVSRYVYVSQVNNLTPNYFDNNGVAKSAYTSSIPIIQSGSFKNGVGEATGSAPALFYENISNTNTQGLVASDYSVAIDLLKNKDDYQYNVITTPGLIHSFGTHAGVLNTLIANTQNRGDALVVLDVEDYGATINSTVNAASALNSSYAATYWPWVQSTNPNTGKLNWLPASTLIPGVYAFNDNAAEPWFAPAGINRGGLSTVVRPERKLQRADRDTLYEANVNPIANFPANGTVVFGQKTLQKQASALDRVNVRRLLIALKSYISQVANNLVFEQNSIATRNSFLAQVNPYLESVQQRQGVYAFKVVMDDSNNTPDVIDQNQLVGQIFLQPTRTAEFIILDFNVLPTGAEFPA